MSATELPPLPEPVESGSMNCEDCGGSGNDGEETYQGEFQPPEAGPCQSCGGSGRWALPLFTRDQMRAYALQANVDLAAESERLKGLAGALISKLDAVQPYLADLHAMAMVRGQIYRGPNYGSELQELRAALAAKDSP